MTRALTSLKLGLNRVNMLQTENPIRLEEMEMRGPYQYDPRQAPT